MKVINDKTQKKINKKLNEQIFMILIKYHEIEFIFIFDNKWPASIYSKIKNCNELFIIKLEALDPNNIEDKIKFIAEETNRFNELYDDVINDIIQKDLSVERLQRWQKIQKIK